MRHSADVVYLENDPLWYKDAIIYELPVRAFYDSDADGVGDFRGLTAKLDYLQDLGITALWLLPFYPSPLKDDGYDIADYTGVHPQYGTLRDFKSFLREAHRRGLRVITELVLNHTSDQHAWFQRARQAPAGSRWRDFYVWSDTPDRYKETRIIFPDFESANWAWDPAANAYYWHRFYTHQPDLSWDQIFQGREKGVLEAHLPAYLQTCRWFGGKARSIQAVTLTEAMPVPHASPVAYLTFVQVEYAEGEPETYVLPLTFLPGEPAASGLAELAALARLRVRAENRSEDGLLVDAMVDTRFTTALLSLIARGRRLAGTMGELAAFRSRAGRSQLRSTAKLEPIPLHAEQSNTSVVYGDQFILKLCRRLAEGANPDLEIGRYLTDVHPFPNTAAVVGALEYRPKANEPMTLAILQRLIPNQGNAWTYTLDTLRRYLAEVLARQAHVKDVPLPVQPLWTLLEADVPPLAAELLGVYLETARLLGQRTGELHVALAQARDNPALRPEPFTDFYRRNLYQGLLSQMNQTFQLLRLTHLPEPLQAEAQHVLALQPEVHQRLQALRSRRITAMRLRCHGDYHLGQVLYTGKDFVIIDFEGEPTRPLSVRRMKRSPLRDVAGMIRSFHYAAYAALWDHVPGIRPEDVTSLEPWAQLWCRWVSAVFLKGYLAVAAQDTFLPQTPEEMHVLLDIYLLEKALYELSYELNNRPDWVNIPLQGIRQLVELA